MVGLASTPFVGFDSGVIFVSLGGRYERVAFPGIVALDAETGDLAWSNAHEYSFTYPVVTEQVVISQSNDLIQAYERGTGELPWEFDTLESRITRPVVAGETVYVQYGNDTVGLDLMDGSLRMEATEEFGGEFAFVEDIVIESDGDTLRGYHVEHETVLWEHEYAATLSPPAIADGVAYVGGEDKQLRGIKISSGEELWSLQLNDDVKRPVVAQERVLAVSGDTLHSFR
jgi:outer membrane protein assembly factor BamB